MGSLQRMQKILREPESMVLLAWGITSTAFLLVYWLVGRVGAHEKITIPYFELTLNTLSYFVSLVVILASIATALALGMKEIWLAVGLALPGGLFMWLALAAVAFSGKFFDARPIFASMWFFPFCAICGPLLIRLIKDEREQHKIYQGALLLMVLLTATAFLLFSWIVS